MALLCGLCSCHVHQKPIFEPIEAPKPSYIDYTKASIIKFDVDGCSWMLLLEDGKKLEPINLEDDFKKEGLKIWVQYQPYNNYSFCMAGDMVSITKIEIRE